jgi:hypothetical protein
LGAAVQRVDPDTQLFWTVAQTSMAVTACGVAYALGYALYRLTEGAARRRGIDTERFRFGLQGGAAAIAILVVGGTSYVLYPYAVMALLLLRWVFVGSAQTH